MEQAEEDLTLIAFMSAAGDCRRDAEGAAIVLVRLTLSENVLPILNFGLIRWSLLAKFFSDEMLVMTSIRSQKTQDVP